MLNLFLTIHPAIDLSLDLDDKFVDLAADGYDAVIRHGPVQDTRLIAKRLASSRRMLVAAPSYLDKHGSPASLEELGHACAILYSNRSADWRFSSSEGETILRPRACLRVNNGIVMRDAALAGLGIALLPTFFMYEQLASGALRHVDVGAQAEGAELYIAYTRNRTASAKVATLTEWLRAEIGTPAYWDRK